jgi:uncharacterized membrane protein HdeD (DUF308 family)/3',5'-cyclic AMP phosphodiesterase CpdA
MTAGPEALPPSPETPAAAPPRDTARWRNGLGAVAMMLAVLALLAPLSQVDVPRRVGLLLVLAAVLEMVHGFRRSTIQGQRSAWVGGAITLAMGFLLISAPYLAGTALLLFLAGWFGLDGLRHLAGAFRRPGKSALVWILSGLGNLGVAAALLLLREHAAAWTVAIAGALRIFATASHIVLSPVFSAGESGERVVSDLGLPDHPEMQALAHRLAAEESARAAIDRGWILGFLATLFAIHLARMGLDRTALGIVSPAFAVLGDLFLALLLAFVVVIPLGASSRRLTRGLQRRAWRWCLGVPAGERGWLRRSVQAVLTRSLRRAVRMRRTRYSLRAALSQGLQIGLPLAAIIAATVPVWGMSWYFNTENWAAEIWNSWAEERTDTWREAMARAVLAQEPAADPARRFAVEPPGLAGGADFAFVVIGDTGEGDASQHSLRAQYLNVVRQEDVRFVIVSSDVVYPAGAMRHYEEKFWLPFLGTTRPVYAIPGNHDWFDALEGFAATFLEPAAARTVLRARVEADNRITSTTDGRIEELIAEASRLRQEYGVPVQQQKTPYFQIQTDTFALFAVDTGVVKRVDPVQRAWLEAALAAARGKTKMVVLGHPFYAGGHYQAGDNPDFADLHALLRAHDVAIVMAGDTHDLEHYVEPQTGNGPPVLHFVNGGGGAYLSFGTALDWPEPAATPTWAFYPSRAQVVAKVEASTPGWKRPMWWWTKRYGAWPFSAEGLAAAFDVNTAPFYQSFLEVRVEPSQGHIRILPHGIRGRLTWADLERSAGPLPVGAAPGSPVEWIVPLPGRSP